AGRNGDAFHVRRGAGEPGEHPAVRHGIIEGHGVTVVAGLTWAAEACEEGVIVGRAVYRGSGLGENLEAGIDNLHIVIAAYVAISVGWKGAVLVVHTLEALDGGGHNQRSDKTLDHAIHCAKSPFHGQGGALVILWVLCFVALYWNVAQGKRCIAVLCRPPERLT